MKRLLSAVCLLILLVLSVPVCAESTVIPADDDDLVRELERTIAFVGEPDYYNITLNREDKTIVLDLAMDGLTSELLALKKWGYDDTYQDWVETRDAFILLHLSVRYSFRTDHREDMRFIVNVVNDDAYIREDYSTIMYNPLLTIGADSTVVFDVMAEDY